MWKGIINFGNCTIFWFFQFDFVMYKQQQQYLSAYFPIFTSPLTYIWIKYFGVVKVWSWGKYKTTIIYSCYHRKYLIATFSPPCSAWRESPRSRPRGDEDSSFWSRRWFSVSRADQDCGPEAGDRSLDERNYGPEFQPLDPGSVQPWQPARTTFFWQNRTLRANVTCILGRLEAPWGWYFTVSMQNSLLVMRWKFRYGNI